MKDDIKIFTGNSVIGLAENICKHLGRPLGAAKVSNFRDGETSVEIGESVRGQDVFLIQSICAPVNDRLMELLVMIDAVKRASAEHITLVIPYYGYARQDRKVAPRAPITAKLVADLLMVAGADRLVTVDLHSNQIQGFFDIPVDNLYSILVFEEKVKQEIKDRDIVVVSPDAGGAKRARYMAQQIDKNTGLAIIDKRRPAPGESEVMNVIGDVEGKIAILIDDIIDSGGSLVKAAEKLKKQGAREVFAACTHPVLSAGAVEKIEKSCIKKLFVTDTIPLKDGSAGSKIVVVSMAEVLATAIRNIHEGESVSKIFKGLDSIN